MLQTWFAKIQTACRASSANVGRLRWLWAVPPGVWIIILVLTLVGGRLLWLQSEHPAHQTEITDAFGSSRLFFGPPQLNHDGSQILYVASAEKRCAIFLANTQTGQNQKLVESDTVGWEANLDFHAGPLAPDDSEYIYYLHGQLIVRSTEARQSSPSWSMDADGLSDVVWLNPREFAYLKKGTIGCAQREADGQWNTRQLPHQDGISALTVISSDTIAWLQDGLICRLNLDKALASTNNPFLIPASTSDAKVLPLTDGLALWLDASTLSLADQTFVTNLVDLSRHKNNVVPNQYPPLYNAPTNSRALLGKGTIHFTSANAITNATGLKTSRRLGLTNTMPRTIFAVLRRDAGHPMMAVNIGEAGGHGTFFGVYDHKVGLYLPGGWDWLDNTAPASSADWNMLEVVYDGTSQKGFVNGALKGTTAFQLNTVDKEVEIGLRTGKDAASSDGDFAELLIYDRALTDDERKRVEAYLSGKWLGFQRLSSRNPLVWCDPQMAGLTGFRWSNTTGQLLISSTDNGRESLWRFNPDVEGTNRLSLISESDRLQNVQWAAGGKVVGTSRKPGHRGVVVADGFGTETDRLFEQGKVDVLQVTPDGNQLFLLGTVSNEPTSGIWQYDLASKQLRSAVPGSDIPSTYAKNNFPSMGDIRLPSGRNVFCFLYPPLHFDPHKKYPLVIINTTYLVRKNGEPEQQWMRCAAACGAYVVIINRNGWFTDIDQWGENVMGLYQSLKNDPAIDTSRIYLAGSSAETPYVSKFIEEHPGPWRGVALLNPAGLSDFSKMPLWQKRPRVLIEDSSSGYGSDRLKSFQQEALNHGVVVDIAIHPDEGHRIMGNEARLERTRNMMHFIFEK
jgi:hypothetical protein